MSLPVYVSDTDYAEAFAATHDITHNSVTAGNLLILKLMSPLAARVAPTITDDDSNTWTTVDYQIRGSEAIGLAYTVAGASGNVTISVAYAGNESLVANVSEWSNPHATPFDVYDWEDNASGTTHYCADAANIDTTTDVVVVAFGIHPANAGTITVPSGYTTIMTPTDETWVAYKTSASALTNERGQWSCSIARVSLGLIASFKGAAAAGGSTVGPLVNGGLVNAGLVNRGLAG